MASTRQTLSMRIALDGADQVKKEFTAVGKSAEAAFAKIKASIDKIAPGFSSRLTVAVRAVSGQFSALAAAGSRLGQSFSSFTLAVSTFGNAIANSARRVALLTGAITAAAGAALLFASRTAANAERIDNQAKSLGLSVEGYQNLENAAKNAGLEQGAFDAILQRFIVNAGDAGDAAKDTSKKASELAQSFRQVEVTAADGSKKFINVRGTSKALADSLGDVAAGLRQVEVTAADGTKKLITVRGTSEALGKSLAGVAPAAKTGEAGLIAFAKKLVSLKTAQEQLNLVMSEGGATKKNAAQAVTFFRALARDADAAARAISKTIGPLTALEIGVGLKLDDAFDRLGTNVNRLKDRLVLAFGPAITKFIDGFADLIFKNQDAILAWAQSIADRVMPVVEDLLALLRGDDAAVQNKQLIAFRDGVIAFGRDASAVINGIVIPAFNALIGILDGIAGVINSVFGTQFSGRGLAIAAVVLQVTRAFTLLTGILALGAGAVQLFAHGLGLLLVALRPLAFALGFVGAAIAAFFGIPVAAGVAIAAGLAAAAAAIFIFWDDISAAGQKAFETIVAGGKEAVAGLKKAFGGLGAIAFDLSTGNFTGAFEKLKDESLAAFELLKQGVQNDIASLNNLLATLGIDGAAVWADLVGATVSAWSAVRDTVGGAVDFVRSRVSAIADNAVVQAAWAAITSTTGQAFATIGGIVERGVAAVNGVLAGLGALGAGVWASFLSSGESAFAQLGAAASQAFGSIQQLFGGDFTGAFLSIQSGAERSFAAIGAAVADTVARVSTGFAGIGPALDQVWAAVQAAASAAYDGIVAGAAGLAGRMAPAWESVKAGAAQLWTGLTETAQAVWDGIVGIVGKAATGVADAVGTVAQAAISAWTGASASVADSAKTIVDAIAKATQISGDIEGARSLAADLVKPFADAQAQIETIWQGIADFVSARIDTVVTTTDAAIARLTASLQALSLELQKAATAAVPGAPAATPGAPAAPGAAPAAAAGPQATLAAWQAAQAQLAAIFATIQGQAQALWAGVAASALAGVQQVAAAFVGLPTAFVAAVAGLGTAWAGVLAQLAAAAEAAAGSLAAPFATASASISSNWAGMVSAMKGQLQSLVAAARAVAAQIERIISSVLARLASARAAAASASSSPARGTARFATGGQVRGPGGPTADRIPALLSAGEYIVRAAAVQKVGPALLNLINTGRYTVNQIVTAITEKRYRKGGIVEAAASLPAFTFTGNVVPFPGAFEAASDALLPRFAGGGVAEARKADSTVTPFTLVIDGQTFTGLSAQQDAVKRLSDFVTGKKLRSAGRRPGHVA